MDILILLLLGFVAGSLGGLLGIGGSVIMIPVGYYILGWDFHLAQAVAMTVNPAVALSASVKHQKNRTICWWTYATVLPTAVFCICIATWCSNQMERYWLELLFGTFLIWVFWDQIQALKEKENTQKISRAGGLPQSAVTGGITGTMAGLLGIGGGLIQVPLLNRLCGLPIKKAIGTSSSIMILTAIIGATVKNSTLSQVEDEGILVGLTAGESIEYALWLIPGALLGGWLGARLTGVLPVKIIRSIFGLLAGYASYKMIKSAWPHVWPHVEELVRFI